jgi:HTH-type transcriptional regulator, sugar sensing transcriptional regulator
MNYHELLEQAGLSPNEAKLYLILLELGSSLAGEISKKSGINRTNVYDALERLIEKGLVSFVIQSNRKHFQPADPHRIVDYLHEKEKSLQLKAREISKIIPYLKVKQNLGKPQQESTIFKGRQGLKSVTEDILKEGKTLHVFGAEGNFSKLFTHYTENWHLRRASANIKVKIIYNETLRKSKLETTWKNISMRFNTKIYDVPSTTWIYADKVAIVIWQNKPIVTLIKSQDVADSYLKFFSFLWNSSKR